MKNTRTGASFFLSEKSVDKELEVSSKIIKPKENVSFRLKDLHGDQSIYLGQSILALVSLNESNAYSEKMNHSFRVELFASLIDELNITPE